MTKRYYIDGREAGYLDCDIASARRNDGEVLDTGGSGTLQGSRRAAEFVYMRTLGGRMSDQPAGNVAEAQG